MKLIIKSFIAIAAAFSLSACSNKDTLEVSAEPGTLNCSATVSDMVVTRSRLTVDENLLSEASVAVYDASGNLVKSVCTTDMTAISFPLLHIGETYSVYAAFNAGNLTFPLSESEIGTLSFSWDTSSVNAKGFPMTWSGSVTLESDGQNVAMEATRLVSKISFSVSNGSLADHSGVYTVSSVALKNSVRTISVFSESQTLLGEAAYSSDSATASDITSVNAGNKISFYTFENLGGTLLPGNTDPWNKVPANISENGDKCTYLEVTGTYSTDGGTANAPVTYRLYLGDDATTNFDLVRNYIYDVTLAPSDEGIDRTSWKIERGPFSDSRSLSFSPASVTMNVNTSATFTVAPTPPDMQYSVTGGSGFGTSTLTLTPTGTPNEYSLVSSGTLSSDAVTSVVATSWDGRVTATLPVTVNSRYPVSAGVILSSASIIPGAGSNAYAEITYNDGTKKTYATKTGLSYEFDPETSLAAISGNVITAISPGDVYVKATYTEAGKTVTSPAAKLHIYTVTHSLSIDQGNTLRMRIGDTDYLTCTQKTYYDGAVHSSENVTELASWTSNDIGYVTVDDNTGSKGLITGRDYGSTTVRASYNGDTASISVEVVKPDFELMIETQDAHTGNYMSFIIVYVMAIDPFSGIRTAVQTVQYDCTYSGACPVTKSDGQVYVDFYPGGGDPPTEDQSASFTATYTGDAGGHVKYGTRSAGGTCYFKAD